MVVSNKPSILDGVIKYFRLIYGSAEVSASNPLPVSIAAGGADADVNIAAVNGNTATAFNSGVVGAGTLRVVLATDVALPAGTALVGKVDHAMTGIGHGVTTVTTAGTDVALAGSTAAKWVTIQSQTDNTNKIAVGATGVDATIATGTGILLDPGDTVTLPVDNLADVFIDSLVNGEGVRYTYGT